jgi:dynein light intermediate chain 2
MRVKEVISEMKNDHFDVVAQMKRKAKEKYGTGHPDESVLSPLMIPVAIIGTKYDIFQEFDPEKKKIISKTLRYVAHQYGASLFYFSNKSDSMINRCKQLVGHYAFGHPLRLALLIS